MSYSRFKKRTLHNCGLSSKWEPNSFLRPRSPVGQMAVYGRPEQVKWPCGSHPDFVSQVSAKHLLHADPGFDPGTALDLSRIYLRSVLALSRLSPGSISALSCIYLILSWIYRRSILALSRLSPGSISVLSWVYPAGSVSALFWLCFGSH